MSLLTEYPYLYNNDFLLEVDNMKIKNQYVKITLLSWKEEAIEEIQSQTISGNINIDNNSAIRRTASLQIYIPEDEVDYTSAASKISINKKIKVEMGIQNTLNKYIDYNILWFPLGIYIVSSVSIQQNTNGISVSLSLKDKMCLLNGECGGTLPASITFHEIETSDQFDTNIVIENPTIYQIIQELVHHWGNEQLGKILIGDVETRIKQVVRWGGEKNLYIRPTTNEGKVSYIASLERTSDAEEIPYGKDVGYIYSDFTYPGELIGDAGSTITDILDKIKNTLGNYEYFYDIEGNFRFQEIKNYLNTTYSTTVLNQLNRQNYTEEDNITDSQSYIINKGKGKSVYKFTDSTSVISYSNSPKYENIKNDFIIWGMRESVTGQTLPFRYHLAIDSKPKVDVNESYNIFLYEDESGSPLATANEVLALKYDTQSTLKQVEEIDNIISPIITMLYLKLKIDDISVREYYNNAQTELKENVNKEIDTLKNFSQFDDNWNTYITKTGTVLGEKAKYIQNITTYYQDYEQSIKEILKISSPVFPIVSKSKIENCFNIINDLLNTLGQFTTIYPKDWRTLLYLQGIEADLNGVDSNYYYTELMNEWRKLYDITGMEDRKDFRPGFKNSIINNPTDMDFFLDFIDTQDELNKYNIENIGRRTKVIVDESINCMFEPEVKDIIFIPTFENTQDDTTPEELLQECILKNQDYCKVADEIYDQLVIGGYYNGADVMIKDLLYQYTNFNESIQINSLPIYYLEPNTRITVQSAQVGISGDYIIQNISLPLDINGTMNISANQAATKI